MKISEKKKYAFFLGCLMPNRYPQIEKSTVFVMETLGFQLIDMEKAACCPAPGVLRSFDKFDWMIAGARNICIAEKLGLDIMTVCNGCFGTLQEINDHLHHDLEARAEVNEKLKLLGDYEFKGTIRVRHIAEILASDLGAEEILPYIKRRVDAKIAIHYGCHFLKPTGIRQIESSEKPTLLEEFVETLGMKSLEFRNKLTCCGAGGGVKAAFAESSMDILHEKLEAIKVVEPDFIMDVCPFCHMQFETGQTYLNQHEMTNYNLPVIHMSQLVAFCMGMDEEMLGLQFQQVGSDYKFKFTEVEQNG